MLGEKQTSVLNMAEGNVVKKMAVSKVPRERHNDASLTEAVIVARVVDCSEVPGNSTRVPIAKLELFDTRKKQRWSIT